MFKLKLELVSEELNLNIWRRIMKLSVNVKQANKRKNQIENEEIILNSMPLTLRELIREIVINNVIQFNEKNNENTILHYLTNETLQEQIVLGKVSFNERYNHDNQLLNKAIENALTSYEDGIYRVFINDTETSELDNTIDLKEGDVLTFIRLTMLAGRLW